MSDSSPFPESPRVVYEKNPLAEVICQLRFPPILEIPSAEPAVFQKGIRSRYPLYSRDEAERMLPREVAELLQHLPMSLGSENVTHRFATADSKCAISLARDFVAISTSAYERWEGFKDEIALAKTTIESVYQPAFYTRIGLRYRNVIDRAAIGQPEGEWSDLIGPWLLGVLGSEAKGAVQSITTQAVIRLSDVSGGFVALRCGLIDDSGVSKYLIDADFFTQERSGGEDVIHTLDRFNRSAGRLFRWAITEQLHNALRPTELD